MDLIDHTLSEVELSLDVIKDNNSCRNLDPFAFA